MDPLGGRLKGLPMLTSVITEFLHMTEALDRSCYKASKFKLEDKKSDATGTIGQGF